MVAIAPAATHIQQVTQFDCWHASLRMMLKWKHGAATEPAGRHTEWLYQQCRAGQNGFDTVRKRIHGGSGVDTTSDKTESLLAARHAAKAATVQVANWSRTLETPAGYSVKTLKPFKTRPGLTVALTPTILAENRLRAVQGIAIAKELDGSSEGVASMLQDHGPLYMLIGWGHVAVVTGVNGDTLTLNDPALPSQSTVSIRMLQNSPCVARHA